MFHVEHIENIVGGTKHVELAPFSLSPFRRFGGLRRPDAAADQARFEETEKEVDSPHGRR
jgi:hypothetical protein